MYASGIGPGAGGITGGVLAYTGTGSMVLPIVIAVAAFTLGALLMLRTRHLNRQQPTTAQV